MHKITNSILNFRMKEVLNNVTYRKPTDFIPMV